MIETFANLRGDFLDFNAVDFVNLAGEKDWVAHAVDFHPADLVDAVRVVHVQKIFQKLLTVSCFLKEKNTKSGTFYPVFHGALEIFEIWPI